MQKKHRKKGFTLTELAIVIAVIAILIAVLVPTFISLLSSANTTADEQAVKSMNDILSTSEITDEKNVNPKEAMEVLKENGINVENYSALDSNNTIYWNSETNRVLLYSKTENAVIYPADAASKYTNLVADNLPKYWYLLSEAYKTTSYNSTLSFAENVAALASGETLQLTSDVTLDTSEYDSVSISNLKISNSSTYSSVTYVSPFTLLEGQDITIDLNGNSLTTSYGLYADGSWQPTTYIMNNSSLYIKNGTLKTGFTKSYSTIAVFNVQSGSSLTLDGVTVEGTGSVLYPQGNSAQVNVINSTITTDGVYCVSTNSATVDNYDVIITLSNSTFTTNASDGDACPVMINVRGTLNIDNCVINGQRQGVIVRAGTANITDTTISCSLTATQINGRTSTYENDNKEKVTFNYFTDRTNYSISKVTWDQGNEVAMGAVVVGNNKNTGYNANAVLTMSGCTLSYEITGTDSNTSKYVNTTNEEQYEISLYMIANHPDKYSTTVTATDCTFNDKVICLAVTGNVDGGTNNGCECTPNLNYNGIIYDTWSDGWTKSN